MNNDETLVLFLVVFVFTVIAVYFGTEFIVKYVDLPFILVFALGIFFPPGWLLVLLYALFKKFEEGPVEKPYYPPVMSYNPRRRPYYR